VRFRRSGCGVSGAIQPNELLLLDKQERRRKLGNILAIWVSQSCGG